jgi:hypothetical protein
MRLRLIALLLLLCAATHAYALDYSDGWEQGYQEGWKIVTGDFYAPFPPFAPFPNFTRDSYPDGFADGVLAGAEAARCRRH